MPESSSIGCPHRRQLPMTWTLSREDGEMILIGLENSFGSILLKCCPIGVCKDLDYALSTRVLCALKLRALNPADAAFNYYIHHRGRVLCRITDTFCIMSLTSGAEISSAIQGQGTK